MQQLHKYRFKKVKNKSNLLQFKRSLRNFQKSRHSESQNLPQLAAFLNSSQLNTSIAKIIDLLKMSKNDAKRSNLVEESGGKAPFFRFEKKILLSLIFKIVLQKQSKDRKRLKSIIESDFEESTWQNPEIFEEIMEDRRPSKELLKPFSDAKLHPQEGFKCIVRDQKTAQNSKNSSN